MKKFELVLKIIIFIVTIAASVVCLLIYFISGKEISNSVLIMIGILFAALLFDKIGEISFGNISVKNKYLEKENETLTKYINTITNNINVNVSNDVSQLSPKEAEKRKEEEIEEVVESEQTRKEEKKENPVLFTTGNKDRTRKIFHLVEKNSYADFIEKIQYFGISRADVELTFRNNSRIVFDRFFETKDKKVFIEVKIISPSSYKSIEQYVANLFSSVGNDSYYLSNYQFVLIVAFEKKHKNLVVWFKDFLKNRYDSFLETNFFVVHDYLIDSEYFEGFKDYLASEGKTMQTIYDYYNRIKNIVAREKITWVELADNIDSYVKRYGKGGEMEFEGQKSHSSAFNALKKFSEYVKTIRAKVEN